VALAGGALGFELSARSTYNSSRAEVDNDKQTSLWHSANTRRYVAEGLGAASLVAAGVAVWLYVRPAAGPADERAARVELAPMVARDTAGLVVVGGF
jgi:hypothetical protein